MTNPEWYYVRDGIQQGPLRTEELAEMLADSQIASTDLIWKAGMAQWEPALRRPEVCPQGVAADAVAGPVGTSPTLDYHGPAGRGGPAPRYAGFWTRVLANVVDLIVLLPVTLLVSWLLGTSPFNERASPEREALDGLISLLVQWLYWSMLESSPWQGTVGKHVLGIVVTDRHGRRISLGRSTGRHFAKLISAIPLGLGFLAVAVNSKKQGWHDGMAGTLVVRKPPR